METKHTAPITATSREYVMHDANGNYVGMAATAEARDFLLTRCNAHDDLVSELQHAEKIILAMLNLMTTEQKHAVSKKLAPLGVVADGITRYHERRAALAKAGAA